MKIIQPLLLASALILAGCSKPPAPSPAAAPAPTAAAPSHPVRGIIVDIMPAQSALMVKHEDIPGFMPAMTMLFKVDAPTLKAAAKDRTITATLYQQGDDFWLRDVKPAAKK
jgi:protein SCO1/2